MNLVRIRELIPQMVKAQALTSESAREFLTAPVFHYPKPHQLTDDEIEFCEQHIIEPGGIVPTRLPYPVFIIAGDEDGDTTYVWAKPFHYLKSKGDVRECKLFALCRWNLDGHEAWLTCHYNQPRPGDVLPVDGRVRNGITMGFYRDGEIFDPTALKDCREQFIDIGSQARRLITTLAFETMNPSSVTLRVKPAAQGKSVQWVESRTHYCILHKKQAEVLRHRGSGPSNQTIERAAHHRRAHLRRLSADRFKHKKGQLVFVKQTWVGPVEWQGTDKKIYTVILNK